MTRYLLVTLLYTLSSALVAQEVVIWSGGISIEDRAGAPQKGTKLFFFNEQGSLVSDVQVQVTDAHGIEIVNMVTAGPWLLLDLPDGKYRVLAALGEGNAQGGYIEVGNGKKDFGYMFREQMNTPAKLPKP